MKPDYRAKHLFVSVSGFAAAGIAEQAADIKPSHYVSILDTLTAKLTRSLQSFAVGRGARMRSDEDERVDEFRLAGATGHR